MTVGEMRPQLGGGLGRSQVETTGARTGSATRPSADRQGAATRRRAAAGVARRPLGAGDAQGDAARSGSRTGGARGSVVEADLVHELARGLAVPGDLGDRQPVGLQLAEGRDRLIQGDAGLDRVLEVDVGMQLLGRVADHPLDEPEGVGVVRGVLGEDEAGHVDVRAAAREGRHEHLDRLAPTGAAPLLPCSASGRHNRCCRARCRRGRRRCLRALAVAAGGLAGEVGLQALQPLLGLRLAMVGDDGGEQAML